MATYLSTYEAIKAGVNLAIQGMGLPGITSANVVVGKVARDRKDLLPNLPGILIANYGNKAPVGGTNLRDDIPYQVLIAAVQASNQDQLLRADLITYWIEKIGSYFRKQPFPSVPSVYTCDVMQDVNFDVGSFGNNVDVSLLVLKFISRESRG